MDSHTFVGIGSAAFIFATVAYVIHLTFKNKTVGIIATTISIFGLLFLTIGIIARWGELYQLTGLSIIRSAPLSNLYESLIFFAWCIVLGYLIIEWKYKNRAIGAFVMPVVALVLAFIEMSGMSKEVSPLVPALQSNWLLFHVLLSFLAYAAFAIAFATSVMYLAVVTENKKSAAYIFWTMTVGIVLILLFAKILDFAALSIIDTPDPLSDNFLLRATFWSGSVPITVISSIVAVGFLFLVWKNGGSVFKKIISPFPISAELLDELTYKMIIIGFPLFTIGALLMGAIWADQAWGTYWSWDPKETWSLIVFFVYAFYLHARLMRGWKGIKIAIVSIIGFISTLFLYLGVNLLLSGLHAYGGL
ncbi:MAG: Cytochrome c biogenesis protein CcsA [Syntrophomonadaceae bacterium]|nr:Cytochrome c biogenesis protein CcsA [Bacillota bacterium]